MSGVGIMQGRLGPPEDGRFQCFPRAGWRAEFARTAMAGLAAIEWIWDAHGAGVNPIETAPGRAEMDDLSRQHGIEIRSVCADYFMDHPLVRIGEAALSTRLEALDRLIDWCGALGIGRIVLPFVDASRIDTELDRQQVIRAIHTVLPKARTVGVELHLETALDPESFARLLAELPDPVVRVNYDSGNSASLGYRPTDEFDAYGPRIGSVHVKDRVLGGGTVPLGQGSTDFTALAAALQSIRYTGDFVLQVARGAPGDEVAWARKNIRFARDSGLLGAATP